VGERGFLATVGGGAAGAFTASKLTGNSTAGKLVGGLVGAVGANILENMMKKKKEVMPPKMKLICPNHQRQQGD
jgi:hypothetical protein